MSWASDDPEKYGEICRNGIAAKMGKALHDWEGTNPKDIDFELLKSVAAAIEQDAPRVWDALVDWANSEIVGAEADHFGGMIDDAKERAGR